MPFPTGPGSPVVASVRGGPCEWPIAHCGEPITGDVVCASLGGLTPEMADLVSSAAAGYLWRWTGRKYGLCPVTVRPCREECWTGSTYRGPRWYTSQLPFFGDYGGMGPTNPALIGGAWFNLGCRDCSGGCSCTELSQIDLAGPVDSIGQVVLDGVVLDPSAYEVANHRWLTRVDGGKWPTCQDQTAPSTADGTLEVTYNLGIPVPAGGQLAAGVLACELARAVCGSGECRLPQRLQTLTRQGVSMTMLDSFETLYSQGTTGLVVVDMWVASENAPRRGGGRAYSPDVRPTRRITAPRGT